MILETIYIEYHDIYTYYYLYINQFYYCIYKLIFFTNIKYDLYWRALYKKIHISNIIVNNIPDICHFLKRNQK